MDLIVETIGAAKKRIRVQAYRLTSVPIAKALADAHRRGVDVQVILDKSHATAEYADATYLLNAGVPVSIAAEGAIVNNKVMVIDDVAVITSSLNFTRSAQDKNTEDLLVIREPGLARRYLTNWQARAAVSKAYKRR